MLLKTLVISIFTSFVLSDSCVTYNFEEHFNDLFSDYGFCSGMPSWIIDEYRNVGLNKPNELSAKFIRPTPRMHVSCSTSFVFTMHAFGTLEFNIYIDSEGGNDQIQILVFEVLPGSSVTIAGIAFVTPQTVKGWDTVKVPLAGSSTFEGYVSVMGIASPSSMVVIDSFRYIPPGMDGNLCQIYEDALTTSERTTTSEPTTMLEPTTSSGVSDTCVTYDFEENFDDVLSYYGVCSNMPTWILDEYSNLGLSSPNKRSTKFITPTRDVKLSCWSSFLFTMSWGGSLEVTIYMDSGVANDYIQFLALQVLPNSNITVAGMTTVVSQNVVGWSTVYIPLNVENTFEGYISALGVASANSTVIIDSFRYVPPGMDESLCRVYE